MKKRKIYMSVPMSLNWDKVQLFKRRFSTEKYDVSLWDRKNYDPRLFEEADSVVFLLPDFSFDYDIDDLPVGVRKEVKQAVKEGKYIYLGYVTAGGDYNIYNAKVEYSEIKGVQGTANKIFNELHIDVVVDYSGSVKSWDPISTPDGYDERLLMLV